MKKSTRKSTSISLIEPNAAGSFSTKLSLPSFLKRVEKLTMDQRNAIAHVGFGSLLDMPNLTLNKGLLGELMKTWSCEKLAFELVSREISITLLDVALILGLRVVGKPFVLNEDEPFSDVEEEYGATLSKRNLTVASIESRLDLLGETHNNEFIILFLLFTFGTFLFPNAAGTIDSRYLYLLKDLDSLSYNAWGAAVLEDISFWLSRRKERNVKYVGGCLILLQIWSYEHIDIARPRLLDDCITIPRVFRWGNTVRLKKGFASEFAELRENQITCNLQMSTEECNLDIIKDFIEGRNETTEFCTPENSLARDSVLDVSPIIIGSQSEEHVVVPDSVSDSCLTLTANSKKDRQQPKEMEALSPVVILDSAPESCYIVGETTKIDMHQLKEKEALAPATMNCLNSQFISCSLSLSSEQGHSLKLQEFTNLGVSNDDDSKLNYRKMEEQMTKYKKRAENLEEENTQLKKEVDELKRENKELRFCRGDHLLKLEKILFGEEETNASEET